MKSKTFDSCLTWGTKCVWIILFVFFSMSILGFDPSDPVKNYFDKQNFQSCSVFPVAQPEGWRDGYGTFCASIFYSCFGYGVFFMIFAGAIQLLRVLFSWKVRIYPVRFIGFCLLQIAVSSFLTLLFCNHLPNGVSDVGRLPYSSTWSTHLLFGYGGYVGATGAGILIRLGILPAYLLILLAGFAGCCMYSDFVVPRLWAQVRAYFALNFPNWYSGIVRRLQRWGRNTKKFAVGLWSFVKSGKTSPEPAVSPTDLEIGTQLGTSMNEGIPENSIPGNSMPGNGVPEQNASSEDFGIADPDTTAPPESAYGNRVRNRFRSSEEEVDGYEIGDEIHSPRKIRGQNVSASAQREEAFTIPVHHPETAPVNLTADPMESAGLGPDAKGDRSGGAKGAGVEELQLSEHTLPDEPEYFFPEIDLLDPAEMVDYSEFEQEAKSKARYLEEIIREYGFSVRVREIQLGPTLTQYQVEPEQGLRVSKIANLADDLAVKLGVANVRIVFPLLGKQNLIGIEIPNVKKQVVRLREVMEQLDGTYDKMSIPIFLGKDVAGKPLMADLATLPHLLIAGRTGTGKSVCLNSIITSIIMTRAPKDVRMLMIDPKMVEMSQYGTIPHLMHPVVTDMKKAEAILAWAVDKMEERYRWLARAGVRHIKDFNKMSHELKLKRVKPKSGETMPETMPFIVIVVDEMADLMMTAPKEVESHIIRLAQKSRAVGIHLILATQKPIVSVITSLIKSNLPARIAFQVSSKTDSRVVLDENGADRLLGMGDMLFLLPGTSVLIRAQGTYLSDDEINRVVESIAVEDPQFEGELEKRLSGGGSGKLEEWAARDELYTAAIEIIVNEQRGSITLLQRMLGIGYGRAARLIDFMQEDGIVGEFRGYNKPREVLLKREEWKVMLEEWDLRQQDAVQAQRAMTEISMDADEDAAFGQFRNVEDGFGREDGFDEEFDDEEDDDGFDDDGFDDDEFEVDGFEVDEFEVDGSGDGESENDEEYGTYGAVRKDEFAGEDDFGHEDASDREVPWRDEDETSDGDFEFPQHILPVRQPVERSQGRSRRRKTPNYEKIRTRRPETENRTERAEAFEIGQETGNGRSLESGRDSGRSGRRAEEEIPDALNTKESRAVLDRIEPNQPKSFLRDGDSRYREIH